MPVRDNRVAGLRPPATRAPELASSFLTTRGCAFQHSHAEGALVRMKPAPEPCRTRSRIAITALEFVPCPDNTT
ncbi:hypothetical protein IEO21_10484 [Rhodonia placenta]|uniref:Uncharacterized protein n=1 Tax=Rhodonia placenta TaxID=104341 RepID=A0A8H7NSE5_9APHY|nr:hypothetical protein IEO21_10484 [Postia placenta]